MSFIAAAIRGNLRQMMADEVRATSKGLRRAVTRAATTVQADLRAQARAGGFRDGGRSVANAWRMKVYPGPGVETLHPSGLVWSKMPDIVRAFDRGFPIRAKRGKFLAFPTGYNAGLGRRGGGRRGGLRVTTAQMQNAHKQAFIIRSKGNPKVWLWCLRIAEGRGLSKRGRNRIRLYAGAATEVFTGNRKGRNQRAGELLQQGFIPMFFLMRETNPGKRLDIEGTRARSASILASAVVAELRVLETDR